MVARLLALAVAASLVPSTAAAALLFSTGDPNGAMAMASTPSGNGFIEHEAADDFVVAPHVVDTLTSATFTGLVPVGATIQQVVVEIYRVFPNDSDVGRTSGPPTFSTAKVPTRVNSPSDVELVGRDSQVAGDIAGFGLSILNPSFTTLNSVVNGINPKPNQTTGGDLARTGQEVQFTVNFLSPIVLPADHYFFVPQVLLGNSTTPFLWLSGQRPLTGAGGTTPFPAGTTDLQAWIRDANLDPDWLRVGTDIVGGATPPTFNGAFTLSGTAVVPEPSSIALSAFALGAAWLARRRSRATN